MSKLRGITAVICAGLMGASLTARGGAREISYAAEDAAYQAAMQMANDKRVNVKRIAFVKLMKGSQDVSAFSEMATIFENALVQAPSEFEFLTHQNQSGEWSEIDAFFDAATDFGDYDKKTLPRSGVFKMADAFIIGQVLDAEDTGSKATLRISLRLIRIDTAERLWAATVEGVYDDPGPDYQVIDHTARMAVDKAVQSAMANETIPRLVGYQVLVLPFDGPLGRAVTQTFIQNLAKNPDVKVLDLPNGSASDRMIARFLRERTGTGAQINNSLLKKITAGGGSPEKLVVLKGAVTTLEVSPQTAVDPVGACLSSVTASATAVRVNPVRVKIGFDAKFLDVNNRFATVASTSGMGEYLKDVKEGIVDQLLALATFRNIALLIGGLIALIVFCRVFSSLFLRVR